MRAGGKGRVQQYARPRSFRCAYRKKKSQSGAKSVQMPSRQPRAKGAGIMNRSAEQASDDTLVNHAREAVANIYRGRAFALVCFDTDVDAIARLSSK